MDCPICLDNIEKDKLCHTSCNHYFCKDCLIKWLETETAICPICRDIIKHFDNNNEYIKIISIVSNVDNEHILFYIHKLRSNIFYYRASILFLIYLLFYIQRKNTNLIETMSEQYDECNNNFINRYLFKYLL